MLRCTTCHKQDTAAKLLQRVLQQQPLGALMATFVAQTTYLGISNSHTVHSEKFSVAHITVMPQLPGLLQSFTRSPRISRHRVSAPPELRHSGPAASAGAVAPAAAAAAAAPPQ